LGVGGDIGRWSPEDLASAQRLIETYKQMRPLVQHGRQYWLLPPVPIGPCAVQYVSEAADETIVFLYQVRGLGGAGMRRARLHGLLADQRYRRASDGAESTGAALMGAGVPVDLLSETERHPGLDWRSRLEVWRAV